MKSLLSILPLVSAVTFGAPVHAARLGETDQRDPGAVTGSGNQTVRIQVTGSPESCVRLTAAGVTVRNSGSPTTGGVINLPAGINIVWAGLYWVTLDNVPPTHNPASVTLNGAGVTPVALPVTASPCWSSASAHAYFADVTGIAVAGANTVAGLHDSGIADVAPESEGASLVVIYEDDSSTACEIIVMDGNDLMNATGQLTTNAVPVSCGPGLAATLWFVGGDGQAFLDDQQWNGVSLGDGDDFDDSDPNVAGAGDGWDTDARSVVTGPPSVAGLQLGTDCLNWVATAIEVGLNECKPVSVEEESWGRIKSRYE